MLTSALDHVLGTVKKCPVQSSPQLAKEWGGGGEWDLCFKTANDRTTKLPCREKNTTVSVTKSEHGAEFENQIKAKSYQQIPMGPDHGKARTPSGPCVEQKITTCSHSKSLTHSQGLSSSHVRETRKIRGKLDKIKIIAEGRSKAGKINCQMECGCAIWHLGSFM